MLERKKKSVITPQVPKAAALEFIDSYPAECVRCYIDGSATGGTSDGGYGVYIEWKSQETTRTSGPVGRRTCSYECEKAALHACIRIPKERHDRGDQLPGIVILCDCRSLVQNLGGFNPTSMGDILSATEELRQADVRIIFQWIPSQVGIHGNEVADELANAGRLQPQPTVPATLAYISSLLRGETAKRWRAAIEGNDDSRLAKLYEVQRAGDYCAHMTRGDAVQVFRMRVNHVLLLASMSKRGWSQSASCRLCENRVEDVDHVLFDCPALEDCRSPGWGCQDRSLVLWFYGGQTSNVTGHYRRAKGSPTSPDVRMH